MGNRWVAFCARIILLGTMSSGALGLTATPASALSVNPLDYYSYEYYIALSHSTVESGDPFSLTAGAKIRCTRDFPVGVKNATARFKLVAHHDTSGKAVTLLERYELTVDDVPDWAGDQYSTTETVELSFPAGTAAGTYEIVADLEYLGLDGWNVTNLLPSSARSIVLGSIACVQPDTPPTPPTPPVPTEPGMLVASILGHQFRTAIDADGFLLDSLNTPVIEGLLTMEAAKGTRCHDSSGNALTYLSASQEASPKPHDGGLVLHAFSLSPSGATFSPALKVAFAYDVDELPPGCKEEELTVAYYDQPSAAWHSIPSEVDTSRKVVRAEVSHFTMLALVAPTATPGPARLSLRGLDVSPMQVAPFGRVNVTVTVANMGGTTAPYPLVLSVAGTEEYSETLVLQPRQTRVVTLAIVRALPGTYEVAVENLSRTFIVLAAQGGATPEGTTTTVPSTQPQDQPADGAATGPGMHPIYVALLILAGVAFITLVVLALSGAL